MENLNPNPRRKKRNWKCSFKKFVKDKPLRPEKEIDKDTDRIFLDIFEKNNQKLKEIHPSYGKIPRFL